MKLLILFLLQFFYVLAFSQVKEEISMKNILRDAGTYMQKIEMEMGQEIVRMEFDLIQSSKSTFRAMTKDYNYGVFAFGDYRIKDIDIKVYKWVNNKWTLVSKDQDNSSVALVKISPMVDSEYMIEISAYKFEEGFEIGHYGLIIYHD